MSQESARKQGQIDGQQGKGPANTNNMSSQERNSYDAAYKQAQEKK